MNITIASWNINSVRLRKDLVRAYLEDQAPDILCLQETKTEDQFFPTDFFMDLGYQYQAISGQKSYNGVAFLSRLPLQNVDKSYITNDDGARHITVHLENGFRIRNFYIPAGGDDPCEKSNPKFLHKMTFLRSLKEYYAHHKLEKEIILGDFNIAPHENDVWSHKQLLKVVSHTPQETELLNHLKDVGAFYDIFRDSLPDDQKLYSWWSYRSKDWKKSNRGRRLDHIWCSNDLKSKVMKSHICDVYRSKDKPSDHVPIQVTFEGD